MAEINQQRQFDWGPPEQSGDSLKEWLVYIVILSILSVGVWLLLDVGERRLVSSVNTNPSSVAVVDQKLDSIFAKGNKEAATTVVSDIKANDMVQPPVSSRAYFVQVGAFGDEPSANEIYDLLKKEGIEATLLRPDEQFEIYRLVVGPFESEKIAEDKAEQLNAIDFPCFVVEVQ